ncbi:MAG: serine/threonine-protein phosphatase, partial [Calditrichaeota bacterium]
PILHYRAGSAQVEQLTLRQIPLAVQADYPFATHSIIAKPGDWFVLITDGLTEVFNDAGEEFDLSVMEEMLIQHHTADPETLYQAIMRAVRSHGRQQDDQTLMLIRCE